MHNESSALDTEAAPFFSKLELQQFEGAYLPLFLIQNLANHLVNIRAMFQSRASMLNYSTCDSVHEVTTINCQKFHQGLEIHQIHQENRCYLGHDLSRYYYLLKKTCTAFVRCCPEFQQRRAFRNSYIPPVVLPVCRILHCNYWSFHYLQLPSAVNSPPGDLHTRPPSLERFTISDSLAPSGSHVMDWSLGSSSAVSDDPEKKLCEPQTDTFKESVPNPQDISVNFQLVASRGEWTFRISPPLVPFEILLSKFSPSSSDSNSSSSSLTSDSSDLLDTFLPPIPYKDGKRFSGCLGGDLKISRFSNGVESWPLYCRSAFSSSLVVVIDSPVHFDPNLGDVQSLLSSAVTVMCMSLAKRNCLSFVRRPKLLEQRNPCCSSDVNVSSLTGSPLSRDIPANVSDGIESFERRTGESTLFQLPLASSPLLPSSLNPMLSFDIKKLGSMISSVNKTLATSSTCEDLTWTAGANGFCGDEDGTCSERFFSLFWSSATNFSQCFFPLFRES
ncbi:hypothetical protein Mp_5g07900 [Marchantia polymorpha subsp. ruderalis]|uniref:Uncharacterized protein n=2 Tax=Marchantia polymorpha TaxID=3197 RepID=A0AAF6BG22_MARPO|nr:hypothetical protein MARPO_0198s0009 [Marchantia polymorpha]BBN10956.1 hypothetical protein Mp_5g07900 [Marchantia polymorpha subsp. ruderalis]|eukprot:PTQ27441.1 hypothetical protein MARPO_0198s0009 [Marchantia polymorpha]